MLRCIIFLCNTMYTINYHVQQLNENVFMVQSTHYPISCYFFPKLALCLCLIDQMYTCIFYFLVHLKVNINVSYKFKGCYKGHSAQHKEKHIASQQRVTKELHRLKHARHVGSLVVVKHRITKHKPWSGTENIWKKQWYEEFTSSLLSIISRGQWGWHRKNWKGPITNN